MDTYKVGARNTTIPLDQSFTFDMGFESPWVYVTVEAENEEDAIEKSKLKLPECTKDGIKLYEGHYISNI